MPESRATRHARHESAFRALNEDLARYDEGSGYASLALEFVCECYDPNCGRHLQMTAETWQRVHRDPTAFVVAPDHADEPWIEEVIVRTPGYWVVRKLGEAAETAIAERTGA